MMCKLTFIHTEAGHKFMVELLINLNHKENMYFSKSAKRSSGVKFPKSRIEGVNYKLPKTPLIRNSVNPKLKMKFDTAVKLEHQL